MATKKNASPPAPEMIQEFVHTCGGYMYVPPRQENEEWKDIESYVVSFRSEYDGRKWPEGVQKSNHKFCPYCGELLFKLENTPDKAVV